MQSQYVERFVNLLEPQANTILNMSVDEAIERVGSGDSEKVRQIDGQFAIVHRDGQCIRMARSIGRPMRYFLAKQTAGPCLVVAERIDEIVAFLNENGMGDQFHPSYTRMVPAHYITELALVGCPDPNPVYTRYFSPQRNTLAANPTAIGEAYINALAESCSKWLDAVSSDEPIGVLFSGGIDSGSVLLVLYHLLLKRGESPARLKAFTMSVDGKGEDARQAHQFLDQLGLSMLLEIVDVPIANIDYRETIRVVEDYKPLDIQSATMALALCRKIREQYPDWKLLVDGDGGDENMKDYPIEENPELTIRSVLNNTMLYQEGWGVEAVKHSLTYTGGQSRGHVRTWAPGRTLGFAGFSPYALPNVIEVAEGIPFIELTDWDHDRLYSLKGEVVRAGVKALTGMDMPVFEKRRFQQGAADSDSFDSIFPATPLEYRTAFLEIYA